MTISTVTKEDRVREEEPGTTKGAPLTKGHQIGSFFCKDALVVYLTYVLDNPVPHTPPVKGVLKFLFRGLVTESLRPYHESYPVRTHFWDVCR